MLPLSKSSDQPVHRTHLGLLLGLVSVLAAFAVSGVIAYVNTRTISSDAELIAHTHEVLAALSDVASLAKDAETGQRGFLLTGNSSYLEPYNLAVGQIHARLADVERLTRDNPAQQARLPALRARIDAKLAELNESIEVRRTQDLPAALRVVEQGRGRIAMDAIRAQVEAMQSDERALRVERIAEMQRAYRFAVTSGIVTGMLGAGLSSFVAYLLLQSLKLRNRQDWLQSGQINLAKVMVGGKTLDQLGQSVLGFVAEHLGAHVGALYAEESGAFRRIASYGVPTDAPLPDRIERGDGLLSQAVQANRPLLLHDLPETHLTIGSTFARGAPRHLLIIPVTEEGEVNGVLEFGFMNEVDDASTEFFARVSETIGVALRAANYRAHLQNLLEETQRQSEELQAQSEELRVSNEELEEQGRALRESQSRLEHQQTELEATNAQLEEQAQLLETQRDDVSRSNAELAVQAHKLEEASRYKSDFLANMSHELRTPLNSSLILAKLLADNPHGNLSEEQVQYAETIRTAGNDLLNLINDILDLSKIEAGHMEVRLESVSLARLVEDLNRTFRPVAAQKHLEFQTSIEPSCPEFLQTDRQRLEQILKNLLSNALKFTEQGSVSVTISGAPNDRIAFAVTDTGIGIPPEHQQIVFEAFRQADGTTNRKFGGTGLGLSISRELTRLLGGELRLASEVGRGSTFTVTTPRTYTAPGPAALPAASDSPYVQPAHQSTRSSSTPGISAHQSVDDRTHLIADRRTLLVIEDDESFAKIVYDLAHEGGFQCLVSHTAEDGFATAVRFLPSAIVLDVGLPDHSGLWVLDRLKHDRRTRHLPVHVISASDYSQTALSLGAVGYMLKPVEREALVAALQRLENRLDQRMGRVLVVEDDPVQRDSMRKLLHSQAVETVGAANAAECLAQLRANTFDCMVLDLSLPDASGFMLLKEMADQDEYGFPPVIVYTGRELSPGEEQQLRRYSQSIIIKGARSPERLLDEVTLFLHQVVGELPAEQQRMLEKAHHRDATLEGRRILIVEDDVRNVFALTSILEPRGAVLQIARNGREALEAVDRAAQDLAGKIDLVLMDVMMPEMDGITAIRELRKRPDAKRLPVIMLTAKAMKDDQEQCLSAGANDYMAKPLDVEKLLSLIRVWMPR